MTTDEHVARAMLLDRRYDIRTHIYVDFRRAFAGRYIDAETLEPLTHGEFQLRLEDYLMGIRSTGSSR